VIYILKFFSHVFKLGIDIFAKTKK